MKKNILIIFVLIQITCANYFAQSIGFASPQNNTTYASTAYGSTSTTVPVSMMYSNTLTPPAGSTVWFVQLIAEGNTYTDAEGQSPQIPQSFNLSAGNHTWTLKLYEAPIGGQFSNTATATITFYVKFTVGAANNFSGGTIGFEGSTVPVWAATVQKFIGETVSVGAIDQSDGTYNRTWNTSGTNNSYWLRNNSQIFGATPRNYSYTVASTDNGATLTADLKKIYHVVLQNSLPEGGGNAGHVIADGTSYNVTAQVPKVEQNTMTIQSDNNQPVTNGIASIFNNWSDGNTSSTRSITVGTDLISYTAVYKGKPLTSGRYLHFNDGVYGSPVTLYWNAHPSSNVTGCNIYRKVRVNGVMGNEYLIASVSASTTSYVDNDYTVSNNTTTQLFYDVRYVYSSTLPDNTPYTTESDPNYVNIYGQTVASYNDSQKETASAAQEIPSDYSIENYPNPFNPTTTINYQLPENGFVTIKVYDVLGKEVATLVNENKSAGYYNVNFDASKLTSGVYIYTINANGFAQSKKMLLMK